MATSTDIIAKAILEQKEIVIKKLIELKKETLKQKKALQKIEECETDILLLELSHLIDEKKERKKTTSEGEYLWHRKKWTDEELEYIRSNIKHIPEYKVVNMVKLYQKKYGDNRRNYNAIEQKIIGQRKIYNNRDKNDMLFNKTSRKTCMELHNKWAQEVEPVSDKEHVVDDNEEVLEATQKQVIESPEEEKEESSSFFWDALRVHFEDKTWGTIWYKISTDQYFDEDGDELVKDNNGEFVEKE